MPRPVVRFLARRLAYSLVVLVGVRPEEITHVLITHAHYDHFAGVAVERDGRYVARFPQARHLIGRADWEGAYPRRAKPESW